MECPNDHAPMKLRKRPTGEFWGCTNYPQCKGTMPSDGVKDTQEPKTPQGASHVANNAFQDEILKRLADRLDSLDKNVEALTIFFRTQPHDQGESVQSGNGLERINVSMQERFGSQDVPPPPSNS